MTCRRTTRWGLARVTWDPRTGRARAEVTGRAVGLGIGFPAELGISRAIRAMR